MAFIIIYSIFPSRTQAVRGSYHTIGYIQLNNIVMLVGTVIFEEFYKTMKRLLLR